MRDPAFDALVDLDGETFVIDPAGKHWVKFEVKRIPATPQRPHGLKYSLTLHDAAGHRVVGFDNAHPVKAGSGPGARMPVAHDHRHRLKSAGPYEYKSAADLLADFWNEVDAALKQLGVKI